jgi:hypothetical protein
MQMRRELAAQRREFEMRAREDAAHASEGARSAQREVYREQLREQLREQRQVLIRLKGSPQTI